jgi:uncharacterized protein
MIIDVDRLPEDGLKISREFDFLSTEVVEENAVFLKPVQAELVVRKVGEEVQIKGKIQTCISFVCSRCLSPFEFSVDSPFDMIALPEEFELEKEELDREDMNRSFLYGRKIDLRDVVLEQLNLTFPLKPLCSSDCQGICPVCGKLIKSGDCSCVAGDTDSRLEKLKNFLRDKR